MAIFFLAGPWSALTRKLIRTYWYIHAQYRAKCFNFISQILFVVAKKKSKDKKKKKKFEVANSGPFLCSHHAAHSPDNSFLGFVVSGPVPANAKPLKKKPIGLVYGKDVEFWKVINDFS